MYQCLQPGFEPVGETLIECFVNNSSEPVWTADPPVCTGQLSYSQSDISIYLFLQIILITCLSIRRRGAGPQSGRAAVWRNCSNRSSDSPGLHASHCKRQHWSNRREWTHSKLERRQQRSIHRTGRIKRLHVHCDRLRRIARYVHDQL